MVNYRTWVMCGLVAVMLAGCGLVGKKTGTGRVELAEFTESYVHVLIELQSGTDEQASLVATFTPTEEDAHLYSKDLPRDGVNGLGRPTLLELPEGAQMQAAGELQESVTAQTDEVCSELPSLPVYPSGPVTLTLPITLPAQGGSPVSDQVSVTYMACTTNGCHAPVEGKIVDVQLPGE